MQPGCAFTCIARKSHQPIRPRRLVCLAVCTLITAAVPFASSPQKPLERTFYVGVATSYRIKLIMRSEVEGQESEQIGAKTYVRPFSRSTQRQISWRAVARVISVGADGTAELEETLDDFQDSGTSFASPDAETEKLASALHDAVKRWKKTRSVRYGETSTGQLLRLSPDGVPALGEGAPRVLTLWLLRALRPTVALPSRPIRFREAWQEARTAQFPEWGEVRGSEGGVWLEDQKSAWPSARLHIVQQISGTVVAGVEKPPEGSAQALFHSESLNTISLSDARLLAAARTATREIIWTLAPVEGLRERPQFRGRLSVEVTIEAQ